MYLPSMIKKNELTNKDDELATRQKGPKVIFKDIELQVTIGQWMQVLPSKIREGNSSMAIIAPLSAKTLIAEGLEESELNNINIAFANLLDQLGIPSSETCILDDYDSKSLSFICHLENTHQDAKLNIRWGSMLDNLPSLTINYQNLNINYDLLYEQEDKPRRLQLESFKAHNPSNGSEVCGYMSLFKTRFTINNKDTQVEVDVSRPDYITELYDYTFRLQDDATLAEYFMNMNFPIAADELFKKLCEHLEDLSVYPLIEIKSSKVGENNITNHILVKYGELCKFILTRMGKKVGFDSKGNVYYENCDFSYNKKYDGRVYYELLANLARGERKNTIYKKHIELANDEVQEIRTLAKTLVPSVFVDDKS